MLWLSHDWSSRAVLLPAGFLQHIRLSGVPLFSYVYHEYVPLMDGDGKIGVSHPDVELMLHARNHGAPTGSGRECVIGKGERRRVGKERERGNPIAL